MTSPDHLTEMFKAGPRAAEAMILAEECRILTTVEIENDEVLVTLPNSEAPRLAHPVAYWRVAVGLDGEGGLVPRFPQAGETGLAIYMDTGEIWLIF